jgi:hypothetical protein
MGKLGAKPLSTSVSFTSLWMAFTVSGAKGVGLWVSKTLADRALALVSISVFPASSHLTRI